MPSQQHNLDATEFAWLAMNALSTILVPSPIQLLILLLLAMAGAISIDNDIIGEPDIECLDQEIRVWVKTRKYFQGRIYAKGKADDPECAKDDFSVRRTKKVHFDLGLGRCGMKSLRSFDPRGMYYGITLVISFHPMFITKVDQAFHVKCFFEEANRGLTAELGVSMIPTTEVEARHGIPGCTYSIHKSSIDELDAGKPAGTAIQFAKVGDKVLHQWHCDDLMFGILINNCFVTDGVKQKVQVIDNRGCPLDPILITGIRYSADLQRAYAESQVFKFADRPGVWFFCQIQMCMKKDGMCNGVSPPSCATTSSPKGQGRRVQPSSTGRRKGSDAEREEDEAEGTANSSNEQDNGSGDSRQGGSAAGYDEKQTNTAGNGGIEGNGRPLAGDYEQGTSDYDSSATNRPEYTTTARHLPSSKRPRQRENQNNNGPYGPSPIAIGYQESGEDIGQEAVTIFGPGYAANQVGDGPYGVGRDPPGFPSSNPYLPPPPVARSDQQRRQELLSTEFETEDDLRRHPSPTSTSTTPNTPLVRPTATTTPTTLTTESIGEKTAAAAGPRKDYVDYEADVTIPPHLTDLLANLQPEDINAQNLQRMFRDSVADRRALLQGFDLLLRKMKQEDGQKQQKSGKSRQKENDDVMKRKSLRQGDQLDRLGLPGQRIETVKVSWDSSSQLNRLTRESPPLISPMATSAEAKIADSQPIASSQQPPLPHVGQWRAFRQSDSPDQPPVIAGQLLIYDLDETPPPPGKSAEKSISTGEDCALSKQGLALLGVASASLAIMLALLVGLMLRLRGAKGSTRERRKQLEGSISSENSRHSSAPLSRFWDSPNSSRKRPPDREGLRASRRWRSTAAEKPLGSSWISK